ncbi:Outer envelope protein [Thalictrum thalictroides]|uniref:Outer envelope protein n=1 Tax=Thalictrum thalictroides TaxID=46969 RepID=A0A7J6WGY8_THATH|nr:Outer envelope protein [Thalictrum thalictroides]
MDIDISCMTWFPILCDQLGRLFHSKPKINSLLPNDSSMICHTSLSSNVHCDDPRYNNSSPLHETSLLLLPDDIIGNDLHNQGKFREAAQKYLRAKNNPKDKNLRETKERLSKEDGERGTSRWFGDHPDTLEVISKSCCETLAALSGRSTEGMPPEMIETASNMIKNMPPEELHNMLKMASSFQGKNPFFPAGTGQTNGPSVRPGSLPEGVSSDMLKTASDMMSKMSPEELQRMFEVASNFKGKESVNGARTMNGSVGSNSGGTPQVNRNSDLGESSSSSGVFSNSRSGPPAPANFPASMGDLKEQMQNQMNDPAMRQMFTFMIKNMSPDMMANMSEQFGIKMSKEEATKAQQAMSYLSPDALDTMM